VITVTAAASGGGTTTTPPGGGTTPPPGGGTTTTPPPGDDTADLADDPEPPSIALRAPRSARAGTKAIQVRLTAGDAGRVQLSLARGGRVVARAGVVLDDDGTADYRLKLPRRSKAGRYTLKAIYTPARGRAISVSRSLTLTAKRSARRASAAASAVAEPAVGRGPRALPDGRFHGERPDRTFKVR
jgi:hypothetical protein